MKYDFDTMLKEFKYEKREEKKIEIFDTSMKIIIILFLLALFVYFV